ncbi:hypothetical protein M0R45_025315 [Rubus argutus]|uniref:MHC class I antigen n=1 Tax=Rubus argutus TaxID=59490 RepID=A0AAW1WWL3_RUBAR
MGVATEAQVSWSGETHGGVDGCARLERITDWALIDAASWWRGEGGLSRSIHSVSWVDGVMAEKRVSWWRGSRLSGGEDL